MSTTPLPPAPADPMLLLHQVRALLPKKENGDCAFADRWILEHVAPNKARRIGRAWGVRASDFAAWYDRWASDTLEPEELSRRVVREGGLRRVS